MKTLALWLLAASAAHGQWKAGVAKADITPREPIWMSGFASRTKPSEGVRQKLWVKALAIEDGAGRTSVIVTADIIGWTREMAESVASRGGVPRERLVLSASHTHSGPVGGQLGRPGYVLEEKYAAAVRRYLPFLLDATVDTIGRAVRGMTPATLHWGQGLAGIAVNRRRAVHRAWPGPVDQDVPVLAVKSPAGELRAVVAGYACHATVLNDYQIGGDWPGCFKEVYEQWHPGAEALFVAGCGADANALPRGTPEHARRYGEILAAAVDQVTRGRMPALTGPIYAAWGTVDLPFAVRTRAQIEAELQSRTPAYRINAARLLETLDRGGKLPAAYPYPVQVWNFGGRLIWIVLSSEVVSDYALRLKARHGWTTTWVSAYANDYCGYIPSLRVLKEGGYEGGEALAAQGHPGPWGERVEELVASKVEELVKRAR
ncbi:MAG: neutral/alkaline non-lysosomal ceramidase N-terminal domain-containing protein [Bryobacteraceae bacterium]